MQFANKLTGCALVSVDYVAWGLAGVHVKHHHKCTSIIYKLYMPYKLLNIFILMCHLVGGFILELLLIFKLQFFG